MFGQERGDLKPGYFEQGRVVASWRTASPEPVRKWDKGVNVLQADRSWLGKALVSGSIIRVNPLELATQGSCARLAKLWVRALSEVSGHVIYQRLGE